MQIDINRDTGRATQKHRDITRDKQMFPQTQRLRYTDRDADTDPDTDKVIDYRHG